MRDPDRITPTLAAIEAVWRKYPDWRLGQLISNLAGRDPFYIEEDALIQSAHKHLHAHSTNVSD